MGIIKATFRRYHQDDFLKIRNFLVETYGSFDRPFNWTLERWNFAIMSQMMNGVDRKEWEDKIGIWEKNGEIQAVVNSEGENSGEVFFQVRSMKIPENILEDMFAYSENIYPIKKDNKKYIQLRIPSVAESWEDIARDRGYIKKEWQEAISVMEINEKLQVKLPSNELQIKTGDEVTDTAKGLAHAKAFDYLDDEKYVKRAPEGFRLLRKMPDYRPDLDLCIVSEKSGEIVSFSTIWYDEKNKVGILEPVGTIPEYQRQGLARTIIYEDINRIAREGAEKVYVGTDKAFYLAIGFKRKYAYNIWEKSFN